MENGGMGALQPGGAKIRWIELLQMQVFESVKLIDF
jgi:hypothetical protein